MANNSAPGTAALWSLLLPGAGQVYTGHFIWAIFWFIVTPGLWIGSGGCLGWVCHILSSMQAFGQGSR